MIKLGLNIKKNCGDVRLMWSIYFFGMFRDGEDFEIDGGREGGYVGGDILKEFWLNSSYGGWI